MAISMSLRHHLSQRLELKDPVQIGQETFGKNDVQMKIYVFDNHE